MATQQSAWEQWTKLNEIEYELKLKSENEVSHEGGWTHDQRIMATVNEVHFRAYRIERRQDILFSLLWQQQAAQKIDRILLGAAVLLLLYVSSK